MRFKNFYSVFPVNLIFRKFCFEYYYATNSEIPCEKEIEEIIEKIRLG